MLAPFEENGVWWLPENPDSKVTGRLSYEPPGVLTLQVVGNFDFEEHDLLHGVLATGDKVTLRKVIRGESSFTTSAPPESEYIAHECFRGAHFESEESIAFDELLIRITHFDAWAANISGFDFTNLQDGISLDYELPEVRSYSAGDELSLDLHPHVSTNSSGYFEFNIEEYLRLDLKKTEEIDVDEWMETARRLVNLITFFVGSNAQLKEVYGRSERFSKKINGQDYKKKIQIIKSKSDISDTKEEVHPRRMRITYGDVEEDLSEMITLWMEFFEELKPAMDLYFNVQYRKNIALERRFLSLAQALEVLHRRVSHFSNQQVSDDKHDERVDAIIESVPENYEEWLYRVLSYSNEPSLRHRIGEIHGRLPDTIQNFIGSSFKHKIADTRNYLTHYDESDESGAKIEGLLHLGDKLEILFVSEIFKMLGLDDEKITEVMKEDIRRARALEDQ